MNDWLDELDRLEREATAGPWAYNVEYLLESGDNADPCGSGDNADPRGHPILICEGNHPAELKTQKDNCRMVCLLRNHARELIDAVREVERLRDAIIDVLSTMDDWATRANLKGMYRDYEIIRDLRNELAKVLKDD